MGNAILAVIFISIVLNVFPVDSSTRHENSEDEIAIQQSYFDQLEGQNDALDRAEAEQE